MKMYSIHDSKAEAYFTPIYFRTTGEALRAFESTCKDPESNLSRYPSDFTLVEIGAFDELTAKIETHAQPTILANASEYALKQ